MLEFSQLRELFAYDIYRDQTEIRHDVLCGDSHWHCRYFVKARDSRKLLNPLTLRRYRARSQRLLFELIINEGKTIADILPLPPIKEYGIPARYAEIANY